MSYVKELQRNWNRWGQIDPLWAIAGADGKRGNKWKPDDFFADGRAEIQWVLGRISANGLTIPKGAALDFGCGAGRLTQSLGDHFEAVVGVDIAPSMVKLAKQYNRHGARCTYHVNATDNLRLFKDGQFAFVYSCIVLQHMAPALASSYIREFMRVLQPGGVLEFQEPGGRTTPVPDWQPPAQDQPGSLRQFVKACVPETVLEGYRSVRERLHPQEEPVMEMHYIKREDVEALLRTHGAATVTVTQDQCAGPNFISLRYTVVKAT